TGASRQAPGMLAILLGLLRLDCTPRTHQAAPPSMAGFTSWWDSPCDPRLARPCFWPRRGRHMFRKNLKSQQLTTRSVVADTGFQQPFHSPINTAELVRNSRINEPLARRFLGIHQAKSG